MRRIALIVAAVAALLAPATASAGLLTGLLGGQGPLGSILYTVDDLTDSLLTGRTALSATNCPEPVISQPFASSGDTSDYFLVDGGDFATLNPLWSLKQSDVGDGYLSLPFAPAIAVSPKICVGRDEPTMRMRYAASGYRPSLRVDALFLGTNGELRSDYVTTLTGARGWGLSPVIRLGTNERAAVGDKTAIALVFTVQSGAWAIDDLYIDPFRGR